MPIDPSIPQCQHIKVNGTRCGSPSLRGRKFCYFHYNVTRSLISTDIPVIEDINSVQYSLNRLAEYILEKRIDYKQASLLIWIMQIAAHNARRTQLEPFPDNIVREHPNDRFFSADLSPDELTAAINSAFSPSEGHGSVGRAFRPDSRSERADASSPASASSDSALPPASCALPPDSSPLHPAACNSEIAVSPEDLEALAPDASDSALPPASCALPPDSSLPPAPCTSAPSASSAVKPSLSEGHGFNRAAPTSRKNGALAPEADFVPRKRPTRQAPETRNPKFETVPS